MMLNKIKPSSLLLTQIHIPYMPRISYDEFIVISIMAKHISQLSNMILQGIVFANGWSSRARKESLL